MNPDFSVAGLLATGPGAAGAASPPAPPADGPICQTLSFADLLYPRLQGLLAEGAVPAAAAPSVQLSEWVRGVEKVAAEEVNTTGGCHRSGG